MTTHREIPTHEVTNQSPPFEEVNLFTSDTALQAAVDREGAGDFAEALARYGAFAGSRAALELGRLANENPPKLKLYDPKGHRIDQVEFHPAYHEVMAAGIGEGLHCLAWGPFAGRNVARAALLYMAAQMESGHCCPLTMTNASVAALRHAPRLAEAWLPRITSRGYDPRFLPVEEKAGVTLGMGMTEKQGGTDVNANTSRAEPIGRTGSGTYLVTGHKWFMSAPMSDAFLVLAQAPKGLSCFLMPRILPDGRVNPIRIQRLKDKLGDRSNASSEVEFHGCEAQLVGEEGRGVRTIIEMVTYTRLDCAVASTGLMRWALANAIHHARHRSVFRRKLVDQPLMAGVLADMALDLEAATALVFRLARAFDRAEAEEGEAAFLRVMTPAVKYWVCKLAPSFVYEAMECLGGNGYVEEGPLARAFRQAPVNAIWEGSGNVMCLDVARALEKAPATVDAVLAALADGCRGDARLSAAFEQLVRDLTDGAPAEGQLRGLVERLVRLWAGALLKRHAPDAVAGAFIATRLDTGFRQTYGTTAGLDTRAILGQAGPVV